MYSRIDIDIRIYRMAKNAMRFAYKSLEYPHLVAQTTPGISIS